MELERIFAKNSAKIAKKQRFIEQKVRKMIIKHTISPMLNYKRQIRAFCESMSSKNIGQNSKIDRFI